MARTRALDFEDRQKDILRAAAVLFAERGYSETLLSNETDYIKEIKNWIKAKVTNDGKEIKTSPAGSPGVRG